MIRLPFVNGFCFRFPPLFFVFSVVLILLHLVSLLPPLYLLIVPVGYLRVEQRRKKIKGEEEEEGEGEEEVEEEEEEEEERFREAAAETCPPRGRFSAVGAESTSHLDSQLDRSRTSWTSWAHLHLQPLLFHAAAAAKMADPSSALLATPTPGPSKSGWSSWTLGHKR